MIRRNHITVILCLTVILIGIFLLYQKKPSETGGISTGTSQFCALDNETDPPVVTAYEYRIDENGCGPDDPGGDCTQTRILDKQPKVKYKRIKRNVPIWEAIFTGDECGHPKRQGERDKDENACRLGDEKDTVHFIQRGESIVLADNKSYSIYYPRPENGKSYRFGKDRKYITYGPLGLLFLVHNQDRYLDLDELPLKVEGDGEVRIIKDARTWIVDIYQQEGKPPLDPALIDCSYPLGGSPPPAGKQTNVYEPPQNKSVDQKELQMEYFLFNEKQETALAPAWWTPECKPAIYLYPEQETQVRVTLAPKGILTYTDPLYPTTGWNVSAQADGTITDKGQTYPYLYYESKIYDELIEKPTKGFVVSFLNLKALYEAILPQLGLGKIETKDFIEYWQKALPYSPYYFVGIMPEEDINNIEPLEIEPKPDSVIRVRVYFEALGMPRQVEAPQLSAPLAKGFRVVEWGGMVKVDKNHPFTCSQ